MLVDIGKRKLVFWCSSHTLVI